MICVDAARFRKDGYLVLKRQFSPAAIENCLHEMRIAFNEMAVARGVNPALNNDMASISRVMVDLFNTDLAAYLAAAKLVQHMVSLHRMGCDESLMSSLNALGLTVPIISTRPFLFIVADALKVPGGYHKTPPHQDFRSIQGSLDGVVVWVPFTPVKPGAYALEVLPGSHKMGLLPTVEDVFGHRVEQDLSDAGFTPLEVELGDAVVFSSLLVHRTGETGGGIARCAASFRFNNIVEPSFVARNYPNPYIYKPDLHVLHEDAATPEIVAKLFAA